MIVITVSHPDVADTTHRLDSPRIRIGREPDNDLVLESHACSRYHAEILFEKGVYRIVDLGSTNGVKVGGRKVSEHLLASDAKVTIGEHTLSFSIPQQETPKTVMIDLLSGVPADRTTVMPSLPEAPPILYLRFHVKGRDKSVKVVAGADYVIGRSQGSDLVLDDTRCSGRHAAVSWVDGRFAIRDLGSANGTFVNGDRVDQVELNTGDRVTIGRTEISVSDEPRESVEEDDLLARTQLGIPLQRAVSKEAAASDVRPARADIPPVARAGARRPWAAVAVVVAVVALASLVWQLAGRRHPVGETESIVEPSADPAEVIVQISPIERKELVLTVTAAGSVKPQRQVTVSAEVPGRVVEVTVDEGSVVRRGDLLARLDDRQARLQIDEASSTVSREQVELAREDFERKQRLFDDGALTRSALDQAKNQYLTLDSAYKSAQARIAQLRELVSKARVTAPISGIVARTLVNPGEFLGPGAPVALVEDTDEVLVSLELSDRDVVKLRPLQVVEATSDAFPGRVFQGVVERVGGTANPVTKGFEVEARIGNSEGSLRSGMILSLEILLDKRTCLVVPTTALLDEAGGEARVMVVVDGTARSAKVTLGGRKDRDVEVVHGLAEGDRVVVYGHEQLRDGQPVKTYLAE
jgi:membrane fusion protein (multidrug efflux system)